MTDTVKSVQVEQTPTQLDDSDSVLAARLGQRGAPQRRVRRLEALIVLAVLGLGLGVRLNGLAQEPLVFHPTRQYRSALIARAIYLDRVRPSTDRERILADRAAAGQGTLEPPIMEELVATAYHLSGGEKLWLARLLSSLIWLAGGVGLYLILKRMTTFAGSAVGLVLYVLIPLGVDGGRSFQPDSLMVATMILSVLALLRHDEAPGSRRLLEAALMSSFCMFVKPMCAPIILLTFASLQIRRGGLRELASLRSALYLAIALGPATAFFVDGVYISGFLRGQASASFIPALLRTGLFYRHWLRIVDATVGLPFVAVALAAFLVVRGRDRSLLIAMWLGYGVFGIAFDYFTETHTYYHLQLVPIVALGGGLVAGRLASWLHEAHFSRLVGSMAFLAAGVLGASMLHSALAPGPPPTGGKGELAAFREIGRVTGNSQHLLFVSAAYGADVEFYGYVLGAEIPGPGDVRAARLEHRPVDTVPSIVHRSGAEWLAVTDWDGWTAQPGLRSYFDTHYRLSASGYHWLLFDLRSAPS